MLIRRGDTGPAVRDVQQRLAHLIAPELTVDGVFGDETFRAVQRFQRERGLAADGIVGAETWQSLVEAGYRLGDRLLWHAGSMMRGDDVRELQQRLNQLGFDAGSEDGIFGPMAHAAVEDFQRNAGLEVDGVAGPSTVGLLRRVHRDHQTTGVGIRARERETLRRLARRGIVGARLMIDARQGPGEPGHVAPSGATEAEVTWQIASRLAARLGARGAEPVLSRGPNTNPSPRERARLANDQGVEAVVSIGANGLDTPVACGVATYFFGSAQSVSESGYRLAHLVSDQLVAAGWQPDCRAHPMTWTLLRETRMPAVVVEPGFLTCPKDAQKLVSPESQDQLAAVLTDTLTRFYASAEVDTPLVPLSTPGG